MLNKWKFCTSTSIVALIVSTSGALAQQAITPPPESAALDEVVVTGSRIQRNGYETPTPVTVVSSQELLERAPSNIPDALNQLPQLQGSQSPARRLDLTINNRPNAGNFLNLRALGATRTLVMLDGVRLPPTAATGEVSVDTLPEALVQRVDIVTGGASAVYGSDAVAGVVNYILDTKFRGLKVNAQTGISGEGDNESYRFGVAGGRSFSDDKIHALFSVERQINRGIDNISDRPLGARFLCDPGAGTAANPISLAENCRSRAASYGGNIVSGPLSGLAFGPDGTLHTFNPGAAGSGIGGEGSMFLPAADLVASLKTWQGFGRVAYEHNDRLRFYAQTALGESINGPYDSVGANLNANTSTGIPIFSGNAFLDPSVQALMNTRGIQTFSMTRWPDQDLARAMGKTDLPISHSEQRNRSATFMAGIQGGFGATWRWDANYVYGISKFDSDSFEPEIPKLLAAVDAVRDPAGTIVCRVTITNPGLYPGCTPINLFGLGAPSQTAVDYVYGRSLWQLDNEMSIVSANINGEPFELWAGPVSVALGAEYRTQMIEQTSNANPGVELDRTGLRGAPTVLNRFQVVNTGVANGEVTVKEVYGEAVVPLLRETPFAKSLDLSAAFRHTDYSTSGGVNTWKLGFDYSPVTDLRVRGTLSRDIRAPSLYELFGGAARGQNIITDVHTGVTSVTTVESTGNANLSPEIGKTKLIGFVYQPNWLAGLGLSVDYYSITISDAISTQGGPGAIQLCEDTNGASPLCALISRPLPFSDRSAANFPTKTISTPVNIAKIQREGMDFELSYRMPVDRLFPGMPGSLDIRGLASNTQLIRQDNGSGAAPTQTAGYRANPKWRGSVSAAYRGERLTVFVQERFTGTYNMRVSNLSTQVYACCDKAPNYGYTDLTLTYKIMEDRKSEAFVSITNLFDKQPPILNPATSGSVNIRYPTQRADYDIIGRYFTVGVRLRM